MNNPNWIVEEKQKLIFDFWQNDEEYDELLERWEWGVINEASSYSDGEVLLCKSELNNYQYEDLLNMFKSELIANKIWCEIQFCNLMHQLRPAQREIEEENKMQLLKNNK